MAKSSTPVETRTESIDVAPPQSSGVISAWDGLYHVFGARAEGFDITEDGLVIRGLTFNGQYNAEQLIADVNHQNRRVQLFPTILWLQDGAVPAPLTDPKDMTAYMVQSFKGAGGENSTRTPEYVRKAFTLYKSSLGITSKRGPKTRTINLKNISELSASTLRNSGASVEDLKALIAVAEAAVAEEAAQATTA